jgi:hypothetical protein
VSALLGQAQAWVEEVHPHEAHLVRTLHWAIELDPAASEALRIAAVTHDIERAYPDESAGWESARDWDSPEYNRWHQDRCAEMVANWLSEHGADAGLIDDVRALVAVHEEGGWREADILQAADSLSFLETLVPLVVQWVETERATPERGAAKLRHSLERIAPALEPARALAAPLLEQALERLAAAKVRGRSAP